MNPTLIKIILALSLAAFSVFSSAATLLDRSEFGPLAVEYGFDNASDGDPTAGDGNLLVSVPDNLGMVVNFAIPPLFPAPVYARTTLSSSPGQPPLIDLAFEAYSVARVGFNYIFPKDNSGISLFDLSLTLFDDSNNQLDFYNLAATEQTDCNIPGIPPDEATCGFFGLGIASSNIAFASIEFSYVGPNPTPDITLAIDSLIYSIPAPGVLWLIGLGFPGLLLVWKKAGLPR